MNNESTEIKWLRPTKYIPQKKIEKELKSRVPHKNITKIRSTINEIYEKIKIERENEKKVRGLEAQNQLNQAPAEDDESAKNINSLQNTKDDFMFQSDKFNHEKEKVEKTEQEKKLDNKKRIYREYFKYLSEKPNIKICDFTETEETDEEYQKRLEEKELMEKIKQEAENLKNPKGMKQEKDKKKTQIKFEKTISALLDEPKIMTKKILKSNIDMSERYSKYCKWVASQLQVIIDLSIDDINVRI